MVWTRQPILERMIGVVSAAGPEPGSTTTVIPSPMPAGKCRTTASMYSSSRSGAAISAPTPSQEAASNSPAKNRSSSRMISSSDISVPSASMTFTPLYSGGLWDAVIIAPPLNRPVLMMYCRAGVGRMPMSTTSHPVMRSPALRA
ncbi:MAG: hypothetical protein BWX50_01271 [Euryarchaeota archaeon ADurb.Bin009]|nr:MAG: hypothetical protein BWX50_01271 [Euryarchaeota archaeon ADurb.Bin009]